MYVCIDVLMHACIYVCIASEPVFPIIFNVHKVFSLYSFHQHIHAVGMAPFGFILEDESKVWIALCHLRSAYACACMYMRVIMSELFLLLYMYVYKV